MSKQTAVEWLIEEMHARKSQRNGKGANVGIY
jgi:hypothetical protein